MHDSTTPGSIALDRATSVSLQSACFLPQAQRFLETLEPREESQEDGAPPSHMPRAWRAAHRSARTSDMLTVVSAPPSALFWLELPSPRPLLSVFCAEKQILTGPGWISD